jgi:hypothetical protein
MDLHGRNLSVRMRGEDVALLHKELMQLECTIAEDELQRMYFGKTTRKAVLDFQKKHELEASGTVDERTALLINREIEGPEPPSTSRFVVKGRVLHTDGKPVAHGTVRAFDKDLRIEELLGETEIGRKGEYAIRYTSEQFSRAEKEGADLVVRAYNREGDELAASPMLFNAGPEETVDLVVVGEMYPGLSEYEQLVQILTPLLQEVSFAELTEDDKHQDVTFLSGETVQDPRHITYLIAAHRLTEHTDTAAEIFYGLFRNGLPVNLPAILLQDPAVLRRALEFAAADNIIPARFGEGEVVESVIARFKELAVHDAVRPPNAEEVKGPLVALLSTALPEADRQEAFLRRYVAHTGSTEVFWDGLRDSSEFGNEVDELEFTFQAGALTGNHLPLVQELQKMRRGREITNARDLVRLDETGWREILSRPHGEGIIGAPPEIPGDDKRKIENYAKSLTRLAERTFPTSFIAEHLKEDNVEYKRDLLTFFQNNKERFDITTTRLESYLQDNPTALDGIAEDDLPALKQRVRAMQRVYRVVPQYKAMSTLLKDDIDSAFAITRLGPTLFTLKYGHKEALGDPHTARRAYRRAEQVHAMALAVLSDYGLIKFKFPFHSIIDLQPKRIEGIPDWQTLFGSLELCECEHCRSVYSPAAYLVDALHFLKDRRLIDPASIIRDEYGRIESAQFKVNPDDPSKDLTAKDVLFQRRGDVGEIELTCENTNTPLPYVDLVNEVMENYVAPPPAFTPFRLDQSLADDLDSRTVSPQLRAAFTSPPLSEHATIHIERAGERWRLHDLAFTYTIRTDDSGKVRVTARSRQTSGTPQELAANPQYINPDAYETLRDFIFPLTLPFDLWGKEAHAYLGHLDVQRYEIMEAFLPGDRATVLADHSIARELLGLTTAEADLITGATTSQPGASHPGVWNLWGFSKERLDAASSIPDPSDSTAWIKNGKWLNVLTGRVDLFLQQSGLTYKEMLALLSTYFVNPMTSGETRTITVQARTGQPQDTCETKHLRIAGMDRNGALRALRFVRLWRKLDWTMYDLDRALFALGVSPTDSIDDDVLTQLSHIQRLHELLNLPVEAILPFWSFIDTARYIDHDAVGQPSYPTLYERLFRNKSGVNPPDSAFTEDPAGLTGKLSDHVATITAALRISVADLTLLRTDANVIPHVGSPPQPDDSLSLVNLSRLYRHAVMARALKLSTHDYIAVLGLYVDPFSSTADSVLFVEQVNAVRAGGLSFGELDYLSRHMIVERERIAPTDEEIGCVLAEIRTELQRIALENTFVEESDAPAEPTVDLEGDLVRQKLSLLGWDSDLIDEAVATLRDAATYRAPLDELPAGVSLPTDMSQITYDEFSKELQFAGAMTVAQRDVLLALSADAAYQTAVVKLFESPRRFVQRNMRSYTVEHFSAALTALPDITVPVSLKKRVYYDTAAGRLYFIGAMSEDERSDLLALSSDAAYQTAIGQLYDAPDTQPEDDIFLTSDGTDNDVAALFDNTIAPADRFVFVLRKLLPHLRSVLSERAVIQSLSEVLDLETQTTRDLLTVWLDWQGHAGQKLLAAFLDPAFAESNPHVAVTPLTYIDQYHAYLLLQKIALIVTHFECTPRQVSWLFTYASAADWPDLAALPVVEQTSPGALFPAWLRLMELFSLYDRLPRFEEMLDDLLSRAIAVDAGAPAAEKDAAKASYLAALSRWTLWPESDLEILLGKDDDHTETGLLNLLFPTDYVGASLLVRLHTCFALLKRLGISASQCRDLVTADVTVAVAETVKQAARAKYDEEQWLEIAKPLRDVLRSQQREALVAYLLANPDEAHTWRDVNDIYSYFLLDVEMSPCQMTSRIKQAISSVQLYVQRCLMNLEPEVLASAEIDEKWREWRWMKNYRIWEANRKIFLYPENWIEPELRDDKSPFFVDLEGELLQNDLTNDTAESAFRNYLEKLDEVARLEVVGMYHEQERNPSGSLVVNVLHVIGRTSGTPHVYYYRRRVDDDYWTAWERIDLDIEEDHLIPVVWQRRLYLFWLVIVEKQEEKNITMPQPGGSFTMGDLYWEFQLAWSEYKNGGWSAKKIGSQPIGKFYQRPKYAYSLKVLSNEADLRIGVFSSDGRFEKGDHIGEDFHWNFAEFRLSACGSDVTATFDVYDYNTVLPQGTYVEGMAYVQDPSQDMGLMLQSGDLPASDDLQKMWVNRRSIPVLKRTPTPFRLAIPHQDLHFVSERPFFYQDDTRVYFVVPSKKARDFAFGRLALKAVDPGTFSHIYEAYREEVLHIPIDPVVNTADPVLFEPSMPISTDVNPDTTRGMSIASGLSAPTHLHSHRLASMGMRRSRGLLALPRTTMDYRAMGSATMASPALASLAMASPAMALRSHPAAAAYSSYASSYVSVLSEKVFGKVTEVKFSPQYRYRFLTFYHPYVGAFMRELNRNGVDGLLQRKVQTEPHLFLVSSPSGPPEPLDFRVTYEPHKVSYPVVQKPYPEEVVDFEYDGAYSQYNWELFFHAPLLIANSLRLNQRFADAQRWFHYIFDPTDTSSLSVPQRYWRTKPFYRRTSKEYQQEHIVFLLRLLASDGDFDLLTGLDDLTKAELQKEYKELIAAVKAWRADPFKPHLVARMRTTAYQKTVVMKYIDNLIAWGDQLFRRDTMESINEATQLYVLAADILGKRPDEIPPRAMPEVQTYNTIEPILGDFSNALVQIEEFVPPSAAVGSDGGKVGSLPSLPTMLYFCVPKNGNLLAYWDTVGDRLFKIRHCMNIEGVVRQLPLFAPPIEPGLLVKAAAAGIDIGSVLSEISAPMPHYRFKVLAQKATELCGELKSLGAALLAALEKRDAERLALLRAEHETTLLKLVEEVRSQQVDEAEQQIAALLASRENAVARFRHYQKLLGAQDVEVPSAPSMVDEPVTPIPEQPPSEHAGIVDEDGVKMIQFEKQELEKMDEANSDRSAAADWDLVASFSYLLPAIVMEPWGVGVEFSKVGESLTAVADQWRDSSADESYQASRLARLGQMVMREHDWVLQSNVAAKEITHIDQQILAAYIRKEIVAKELENHRKQIEQAQKLEETMGDKYTNQELYNWMIGQISTVYFQSYQLAYDVAKRAERAFRHELGLSDSNYIQFGYWDSLKKGLLAGERLSHDLKRMEVAYLDKNRREYELTKHVSLAMIDPMALIQLKNTGRCNINLPETIFDMDHPGHYMRRLKNVSLSVPCVVGPYTSVSCKLSLVSNKYRKNTSLNTSGGTDTEKYREVIGNDQRFVYHVGMIQSIATSKAQNDSGMFELNFRDERYLPFEGAGAISTWQLEMPTVFKQFDYSTISDVIIHVRYTARDGGTGYKALVEGALRELLNELLLEAGRTGLYRAFDLRHEFTQEWHRLKQDSSTDLVIDEQHLPLFVQGHDPIIEIVTWFARVKGNPQTFEMSLDGSAFNLERNPNLNNLCEGISDPIALGTAFTLSAASIGALEELILLVKYTLAG